mmetsp:Transcript_140597/g.437264  ORF Transcript_140597/g.437264 Transcript_140597/m.437264 type:complete len:200 (-) Transcript_140597:125-724(-)
MGALLMSEVTETWQTPPSLKNFMASSISFVLRANEQNNWWWYGSLPSAQPEDSVPSGHLQGTLSSVPSFFSREQPLISFLWKFWNRSGLNALFLKSAGRPLLGLYWAMSQMRLVVSTSSSASLRPVQTCSSRCLRVAHAWSRASCRSFTFCHVAVIWLSWSLQSWSSWWTSSCICWTRSSIRCSSPFFPDHSESPKQVG